MKEQLPVGLFGPDWFEVEPDELVDIGNAGKETIKYTRSDLLQKQIEEAVKKDRARCLRILDGIGDFKAMFSDYYDAMQNGEEA